MVQLVWFKRDLRVQDNRALAYAARSGPVVPFFAFEPELWHQPDMSARHWNFVRACLTELDQSLRALGQPLLFFQGEMTEILDRLDKAYGIDALWSHQETGNGWTYARDLRVGAWCRNKGIPWREERQGGVIRRLKSRDGWADRWDRLMKEDITPPPVALTAVASSDTTKLPTGQSLDLKPMDHTLEDKGGRSRAESLLSSFLECRGKDYRRQMSSPNTAFEACSRLSPHLAWGSISTREVTQATWYRQRALKSSAESGKTAWRGSLNSFAGRLHWRCHFMQKLEDEPALESSNLHPAFDDLREPDQYPDRLSAWEKGETGIPFIDACMRALNTTGWLNFRMRAMLMSFASYNLWLDWRESGKHLARQFTDYEPGIHWSQAQMQSGTTGINAIRIYNPVKQGVDQDPDGVFIRRWVPELSGVPGSFLHEPWKWPGSDGLVGRHYPHPIVDYQATARKARDTLWRIRGREGFRSVANAIADKHGSRKSGIRQRGQRPKRASKPTAPNPQFSLFGEA